MVRYPLPLDVVASLAWSVVRGSSRSFRQDAQRCVARLSSPIAIIGSEHIPVSGASLITVNHYARPGFKAWWLAIAISSTVAMEVHWVLTEAWTYPDLVRAHMITPFSRWLFRRIAGVYGFSLMPPMPPRAGEESKRAKAVRNVLRFARSSDCPVIGLAPEGGDFAAPGQLSRPPRGAGRFAVLLNRSGLPITPVGIYEKDDRLNLHFGERYAFQIPARLEADELDKFASRVMMERIADLLPKYG
jgi:hypothetical protein